MTSTEYETHRTSPEFPESIDMLALTDEDLDRGKQTRERPPWCMDVESSGGVWDKFLASPRVVSKTRLTPQRKHAQTQLSRRLSRSSIRVVVRSHTPSHPCLQSPRVLASTTAFMSSKRKWDQAAPEDGDGPSSKATKVEEGKTASEAAAAAAAIAAKIAAQFASSGGPSIGGGSKDPHDGDFTHDIDINDVRNRYLLTKGSTQQQVCWS